MAGIGPAKVRQLSSSPEPFCGERSFLRAQRSCSRAQQAQNLTPISEVMLIQTSVAKSLLQRNGKVEETFEKTTFEKTMAASWRLDGLLATHAWSVRGENTSTKALALSGTADLQNAASFFDSDLPPSSTATDTLGFSAVRLVAGSNSFAAVKDAGDTNGADAAPFDTTTRSLSTVKVASPVTVADGATVEIAGASTQAVTFAGITGRLILDDAQAFTGEVSGLTGSDALDLTNLSYGPNTRATFSGNAAGGTLTVTNGTQTASIILQGNYLSSSWTVSSDGHGGTLIVDPVTSSAPSNTWQELPIGAGGMITGIDIAPDDTLVVRTDTYGAYLWNGTQWEQLVSSASMPANVVIPNSGMGVDEIQIAPSNSNILYMSYDGYVFQSTNKGTTWTETAFAHLNEPIITGGDVYRYWGQKMAVDPNNPNVVYVGTPQNGLFVTTNGGASWTSVASVPDGTVNSGGFYAGVSGIEFDPALGVTGGKTNTIFAVSQGNGVYESTNAGASWSSIGGPSEVIHAAVSSTGVYYAVDNSNDLWSFSGGTWTKLLSSSVGIEAVAVDPSSANEIVVISPAGWLNISYNGGKTWSGFNTGSTQLSSSDIPWLANTGPFMAIGDMVFDQQTPNELWATGGVGVWNTTGVPASGFTSTSTVNWQDHSLGIEQLVANEILVPPGGNPVLASFDRPFFYVSNLNAFPSNYSPVQGDNIVAGWSLDYASSNPSFVVGLADWWGTEELGYSTNGGQTWTPFPSFIPGADSSFMGGTIAASTPQNIIWAPADGHDPYYTLDGGKTWNPITLPGVSSWSNFDFAWYLDTRTVTADRVLANTFYLYYAGNGVYKTTNGGATWTQVFSGSISPGSNYNGELESVPGEAGNLFFTGGLQTVSSSPTSEGFYEFNKRWSHMDRHSERT